MSWWNLPGSRSDVIGDEPADIVAEALGRAATLREKMMKPGPVLPEILFALGQAVTEAASELDDPPPVASRIVVTPGDEIESCYTGQDLVVPLAAGIRSVAAAYRERFERKPRLAELLAVFAFVLRPRYPDVDDLEIRPRLHANFYSHVSYPSSTRVSSVRDRTPSLR